MTPKQFERFLARDGGCVHCGSDTTLIPQHRANRGMGGSKVRDVPSNIIVFCSWMNLAVESSAPHAQMAKDYGWKLESWQDPLTSPVYDTQKGEWILLDDDFGRIVIQQRKGNYESKF